MTADEPKAKQIRRYVNDLTAELLWATKKFREYNAIRWYRIADAISWALTVLVDSHYTAVKGSTATAADNAIKLWNIAKLEPAADLHDRT